MAFGNLPYFLLIFCLLMFSENKKLSSDEQYLFARVILHTKRDFEPCKIEAAEKALKVQKSFLSDKNASKNRRNLRVYVNPQIFPT